MTAPLTTDHYEKTLAVARKAREILKDETCWTQHVLARDKFGKSVPIEDHDARCFCLSGALYRAAHDLCAPIRTISTVQRIMRNTYPLKPGPTAYPQYIESFNDYEHRTYANIRELLENTIIKLENIVDGQRTTSDS